VSGHVFHPGHHELHGVTVVLDTEGKLWVGRFDTVTPQGYLLKEAGCFEDGLTEGSREEYLQRTRKFGVRVTTRNVVVPEGVVRGIKRLGGD